MAPKGMKLLHTGRKSSPTNIESTNESNAVRREEKLKEFSEADSLLRSQPAMSSSIVENGSAENAEQSKDQKIDPSLASDGLKKKAKKKFGILVNLKPEAPPKIFGSNANAVGQQTKGNKAKRIRNSSKDTSNIRKPSAFFLFSTENRELVKKENPGIKAAELRKKLSIKWSTMDRQNKEKYEERAISVKQGLKEEKHGQANRKSKSSKTPKKRNAEQSQSTQESEADEILAEEDSESDTKEEEQFDDDAVIETSQIQKRSSQSFELIEVEDENLTTDEYITEWMVVEDDEDAGDIEFVLGRTLKGEIVAKRKGMDYTQVEYEENPVANKELPSDNILQSDDAALVAALKRYEQRRHEFKKELKKRTSPSGSLNLENLFTGTSLEVLTFLGNMREDIFPSTKNKLPEPDIWMKVPMLGFSFLIQSMIDGERLGKVKLAKQLQDAQQQIQELEKAFKAPP